MEGLAVAHPARAAAGDEGQRAALLHPVQKFGGLLHDGEVGGVVHVKDLVEAQAAQGGDHLALHVGADGQAELLAQGRPHAGGGLHDDMAGGVAQRGPHFVGVVPLHQRAGGADVDALAAADAGGVRQLALEGAGDVGIEAALHHIDHTHALILGAGGDAAAADDALGVVLQKVRRAVIVLALGQNALESVGFVHAVLLAQAQQLTVAIAHTAHAVLIVDGEDQLQIHLSGILHPLGVGEYLHALAHRVDAGGQQVLCALHFHHADPAGSVHPLNLL